jgi:transposase
MTLYCGVDFHSRRQTVCYCNTEDGEVKIKDLHHYEDDVRAFYKQFKDEQVIVGYETSGYARWFETMLFELGYEIWVGDAAEISRLAKRRQKNDRRDAEHILDLMLKDEFPRLYRASEKSERILRLLRHRQKLVKHSVMIKNSLRRIFIETGLIFKETLASKKGKQKLREISLPPLLAAERDRWLELLIEIERQIGALEVELKKESAVDERVQRLLTHPGIGYLTALCIVHTLGETKRFASTGKVAAYAGLEPMEHSSGERRRYGAISKAGNRLLRFLLGEAAHMAARSDDELKQFFRRLKSRCGTAKAVTATARKLLIRAFIMLRDEIDYAEFRKRGVEARSARVYT